MRPIQPGRNRRTASRLDRRYRQHQSVVDEPDEPNDDHDDVDIARRIDVAREAKWRTGRDLSADELDRLLR
jgi:hypothetical protein